MKIIKICNLLAGLMACLLLPEIAVSSSLAPLRLLKNEDMSQRIVKRGEAMIDAFDRIMDASDIIHMCTAANMARNDEFAEKGQLWLFNASLKSCCSTFGDAALPASIASLFSKFVRVDVSAKPLEKLADYRVDAASFAAEQLLNIPVEDFDKAMEPQVGEAVSKTLGICTAARDIEERIRG